MTPSQQQLAISLLTQALATLKVVHEGDLYITNEIKEFLRDVEETEAREKELEAGFERCFNAKISNALNQD